MKIVLERRLNNAAQSYSCTVCGQVAQAQSIRMMLFDDRGWIHGDVCQNCIKLQTEDFQQKLRDRANHLLQWANPNLNRTDESQLKTRDRAIELFQLANETLQLPTVYQWWFKRFQIFSQETQELETARLGLNRTCCQQRSRLEKTLHQDFN